MTILLENQVTLAAPEGSRLHFARGRFSIIPNDELNQNPPIRLFGLPLADASLDGAAKAIVRRATNKVEATYQFVNAHCVNMLHDNRHYPRALSVADALLPDGSGMRLAARISGEKRPTNLNGTDLFPLICAEAAAHDQSIYLLGGEEGVAKACAQTMEEKVPGVIFAGHRNGFWTKSEEAAVIDAINASGASILLVGLGVPHQEIWIARNRRRLRVPVVMGVGGLFDYYSGRIPRAPKLMRGTGVEWIWRLMQEPKRLAARYLIGNPLFVIRTLVYTLAHRGIASGAEDSTKRAMDMFMAGAALIMLSPLILTICLAIKFEDRGPIFFKQMRIGKDGRPFKMWKFRSMVVDAEARRAALLSETDRDDVCFKMKRDPRITRVGNLIRRASLDELPQLVNVLKGDMSIVGPRPALPQEAIAYRDRERARLAGLPGITCIWQVSGRAEVPFKQQVAMDVKYLRRRSIAQDIKLIAKTVPAVLTGRGAY